jgi:hypothetical protein
MIHHALQLASQYLVPVFPCRADKKPLTPHGFKDASVDEAQIRKWWTRHPDALIAVPTGATSGMLVIDVDPAGTEFIAEQGNRLTTGRRHITPRGKHYLYRMPSGISIKSTVGKLAKGVDVRADNGYIIWWPATGRAVTGPDIDVLFATPPWLVDLLADKPRGGDRSTDEFLITQPPLGLPFSEICELLKRIDPDSGRGDWIKVLMAVHHETGGSEAGFNLVNAWSATGLKYKGIEDLRSCWRSFKTDRSDIVGAAWLKKFSTMAPLSAAHSSGAAPRFAAVPDYQYVTRESLQWLIKGALPKAELAVTYGAPGSGKSFLVFDMAASVATGRSWNGRKTKRGRVFIVVAEGATGYRNRLLAYAQHYEGEYPGIRIIADAPNLLCERDYPIIAKQIEVDGGADLIVVDTLAAASAGADENSGEDMGTIIDNCKQLHKQTGALIWLVHHSGKDGSRGARGWSGLKAAADAEIEVTRFADNRVATITKLKDADDGAKIAFKLLPVIVGIDEDGDEITSCVVEVMATVPALGRRKEPKPETNEGVLLDVVRGCLSVDGSRLAISAILDAAVNRMIKPEGRDTRRQHAKRALQSLANKSFVTVEGDECIAI